MTEAYPTAAVLLCAGASTRMGSPKGLLALDGIPLLVHHVEALRPFVREVVVVLGLLADLHESVLPSGIAVVRNEAFTSTTMIDSIRLALGHLGPRMLEPGATCLVTPVDVPPASPSTIRTLLGAGAPAVPVDGAGNPGHPVLIDADILRAVRDGSPPGGLRSLTRHANRVVVDEPDVARDFDTPEAWLQYLARRHG